MSTSISLNPMSLVEYFRNRRNRTNDQIAQYLADIAAEAKCLSEVWESLGKELHLKEGRFNAVDQKELLKRMEAYKGDNAPHFARLMEFYRSVSLAMGGRLGPPILNEVVHRLGTLLHDRNVTLSLYERALQVEQNALFFGEGNTVNDFEDVTRLAQALHREAAALDVLAKTVKVQLG